MLTTRTGSFPIGFRRGWSAWQRDLPQLIEWAKENDLGVIDVGNDGNVSTKQVTDAGLTVGSADLLNWSGLITEDVAKRKATVDENAAYVKECVAAGTKNFFVVMLPDDKTKSRKENFSLMVEGLNLLTPHLDKAGARLVVEGWPGPGALACTPEGYRAMIKEVPSKSIGVNYDPSHLIRMGIDPIRFLEEFAYRVYHVHGKDTELLTENMYEYGTEQPGTFKEAAGFGGWHWRYTIPGRGVMRWTRSFEILAAEGYQGAVSIELEDEKFNGTDDGEKAGILAGALYLANC